MEIIKNKEYTVIIRKSQQSYIAVCLVLNISSIGETLEEVELNLKNAVDLYLEDIAEHPETIVEPISINNFTEFLKDTAPDNYQQEHYNKFFKTFELNNISVYA